VSAPVVPPTLAEPPPRPALDTLDLFRAVVAIRNRLGAASHPQADELAFIEFCAAHALRSRAQLLQDLFVLYMLGRKRGGFFVEFGATDGVNISNTVLLERDFGWSGVLAEPARFWHEQLRANRRCTIITGCVWHTTGETLLFNETADRELSTIDSLSSRDGHAPSRVNGERYEVRTVSLLDLLAQANAPRTIDYLSIDTEGSEPDILGAFDFDRYDIGIITVEHNYTPNRQLLHQLLVANGYERKFEALSQWDDWYVRTRR
jgi:FkbM family methyltransferase